jgi:NADH-quinone oxidoreductase subunit G
LIVQVKNNKVMRVVPLENEAVNECWIADRDRYSYEALNSEERLTSPMLKQGGEWKSVDWQTALEYVANGLQQIKGTHGASSIGALVSPHSTVEELRLASALVRGLGSENVDHRLRNAEFEVAPGIRYLGTSIASLTQLQRVLVVGSNLRKDHPLFAQRIRQAVKMGCLVNVVAEQSVDWAMPIANIAIGNSANWAEMLADIAKAISVEKGIDAPIAGNVTSQSQAIAKSLMGGDRKAVLLGNAAAHHANASGLLSLANWIGNQTGATVGYLTEAANTVGAQWAGALPGQNGLNAGQMLSGALKAVLLLNTEPAYDSALGVDGVAKAEMVVTLSPFKANLDISDVLLPIAPFTETSGTFVNAEGLAQSFHAVVKPAGETRPAWKVLRVLANLLKLPGFDFESSQAVLQQLSNGCMSLPGLIPQSALNNTTNVSVSLSKVAGRPNVASIYQLDSIVRRATSLQLTADARAAAQVKAGEIPT